MCYLNLELKNFSPNLFPLKKKSLKIANDPGLIALPRIICEV